jgi:glutamate dehydrogenase/leucine dehydrogenase
MNDNVEQMTDRSEPDRLLNIKLPWKEYDGLVEASKASRRDLNVAIGLALGFVKVLLESEAERHQTVKVYLTDEFGRALKELTLPAPDPAPQSQR